MLAILLKSFVLHDAVGARLVDQSVLQSASARKKKKNRKHKRAQGQKQMLP
jgi:hypothetical protein